MSDIRYAVRQLARSPGFTFVAAVTLAIGIGANTALFSLGNAILAKPLREIGTPERLAWIAPVSRSGQPMQMSYPAFRAFREQAGAPFTGMAAVATTNFSIAAGGEPARVNGAYVSASYFSVLQTRMLRGRSFTADEDASPGGNPVAVIGERFWRERLGGRDDIVGSRVSINGIAFSVVGVAAALFNGHYHSERLDAWVPVSMVGATEADRSRLLTAPEARWLSAFGRLADDVEMDAATPALAAVAGRLVRDDSIGYREIASAKLFSAETGMRPADMQDIAPVPTLAAAVPLLAGIGIGIGLALSAAAASALASSFLGLSAADALPMAGVALLLAAAALGAVWIPSRRAAGIDPMVALRSD